jgi:hypothetical protein
VSPGAHDHGSAPPRFERRRLLAQLAAVGALSGALVVGGRNLTRPSVSAARIDAVLDRVGPWGVFDLRWGYGDDPVDGQRASRAFEVVLAAIAEAGGGVLYVPPGDWALEETLVLDTPGTTLLGAGMRATRLRSGAGGAPGGWHAVRIVADDICVERLTVVGHPDNIGQGINGGDNVGLVVLRDLVIQDTTGYGIGFQQDRRGTGGIFEDLTFENVTILDAGNDGIDFKNFDADDPRCDIEPGEDDEGPLPCNGSRSFLRNISVVGHARLEPDKRGLDIRGQRLLQNIDVLDVGREASGIVLRPEAGGGPNGRGGRWSVVENWYVTKTEGEGAAIFAEHVTGVAFGTGRAEALSG